MKGIFPHALENELERPENPALYNTDDDDPLPSELTGKKLGAEDRAERLLLQWVNSTLSNERPGESSCGVQLPCRVADFSTAFEVKELVNH